jgi:hypothetical protein
LRFAVVSCGDRVGGAGRVLRPTAQRRFGVAQLKPRSSLSFAFLVALAATPGCCLLGEITDWGCASWMANTYTNASYDDVYQIAFYQIDRDYDIALASNPSKGLIETEWDTNTMHEATRTMQRERVIVEVEATDEGITLKLRVQRQIRERTGLLAPDDSSDDGWSYTLDDFERARVLFGRIQALLQRGDPSPEFYDRPAFELDRRLPPQPPNPGDR